jgi:hypothetical protein
MAPTRGLYFWGMMSAVNKWLDEYELELALRDCQESPEPIELWHAWLQKELSGQPSSWYWDEPKDDQ